MKQPGWGTCSLWRVRHSDVGLIPTLTAQEGNTRHSLVLLKARAKSEPKPFGFLSGPVFAAPSHLAILQGMRK